MSEETPNKKSRVIGFSNRTKIIFVTITVAITILLPLLLVTQNTVAFHSVSEIVQMPPAAERVVGIKGKLVPGTYYQDEDTNGLTAYFTLRDEEDENMQIKVAYGTAGGADIGQLFFNEHSIISAEGTKDGTEFMASRITVKCPSKYQTDEDAYADGDGYTREYDDPPVMGG